MRLLGLSPHLILRTTATIAGLCIGALVTKSLLIPQPNIHPIQIFQVGTTTASTIATSSQLILLKSEPLILRVPAINLKTGFVGGLGLNKDNTVEVPESYTEVGWYRYGPTPGELGPAVILGHVDSFLGPAVFYNLRKIKLGDEIFVDRTDGTTAIFTVTETESVAEADFPTNRVYDTTLSYPALRLITCTGTFDRLRHRYNHNLIIYAKLSRVENNQPK